MSYQVFIERARDQTPESVVRLAHAIGGKSGTPPAAIAQRLSAGRLRVKSGVDLATARQVAAQLEQLGAVCTIEDAGGRPVTSPGRPGADEPVGLAAALGPGVANQDLGALAADAPQLSLATLDGRADDDLPPPAIAFAQADGTTRTVTKTDDRLPADDAFAPPEQAEPSLQLAIDRSALGRPVPAAGQAAPAPAPARAAPAPGSAGGPGAAPPWAGASSPAAPGGPAPGPGVAPWAAGPAGSAAAGRGPVRARAAGVRAGVPGRVAGALGRGARLRLAAGVAIALAVGFVPAHIVASVRERAAFADIDGQVTAAQAAVATPDEWEALDDLRGRMLADKESRRRSIAATSVLLWALVAAGVAFAWFRKIDWDRLAGAGAHPPE